VRRSQVGQLKAQTPHGGVATAFMSRSRAGAGDKRDFSANKGLAV